MNSVSITGYVINGPVIEGTKDPNNPRVVIDILITNNWDAISIAHVICYKYVARHTMKHIHLHDYVYVEGILAYYGSVIARHVLLETIPAKEKAQGIKYIVNKRKILGVEKPNAEYGDGEELEDFDGLVEQA